LDNAIVLYLPGPHTVTGEDMVELHCHGGRAVVAAVIRSLEEAREFCGLDDVRPAEAGEFTKRGFLNGKIKTIEEVEGLADLLNADTEAQRVQALALAGGALASKVETWRAQLSNCIAGVEAVLDFSSEEEDVQEERVWGESVTGVKTLLASFQEELSAGERGEVLRGGVKVVLTGAPNAGKSSLFNALCRREVAIVSPTPGTTRDVLSVTLDLGGVMCRLFDTAGMRSYGEGSGVDNVEREGIRRAQAEVVGADVIVLVIDSLKLLQIIRCSCRSGLVSDECESCKSALSLLLEPLCLDPVSVSDSTRPEQQQWVIVMNKCDALPTHTNVCDIEQVLLSAFQRQLCSEKKLPLALPISASTALGLPELLVAIESSAKGVVWGPQYGEDRLSGPALLTRPRYRHAVQKCISALGLFLEKSTKREYSRLCPELAAEDLREGLRALEPLIGTVDREEVLGLIFERFCIGK